MASASSTHLVLFIAAVLVAASLAGTVTEGATRLGSALEDQGSRQAAAVNAEIAVVSDAGSPRAVYDHDSETLTLYVKNLGASTLPARPDAVTVLVNGTYQSDVETTVLDGDAWRPGNLLRVTVSVALPSRADTRVVVTPTGARDLFRFRTPHADSMRAELVWATQSGGLRTIDADGAVTRYDATAAAVGPKEIDFDGDDRLEVPYVNASGALKLVDDANQTTTLVAGGVEANQTLLAVGEWRNATSVFYANESDSDTLYRVRPGSSPSQVTVGGSSLSAGAAAGVGDVNGDGDDDLVYTGTSQELYYVDGDRMNTVASTIGQNDGIGVGAPRTFDGAAPPRIPAVDTSSNRVLYDYTGTKTTLTSGSTVGPVAGFDWRDDHDYEYVYAENGDIRYVTLDGTTGTVAENVSADPEAGVA